MPGALLSLDDFGTGYSSLAYLQRFPFDTIKIDKDLLHSGNLDGSGSPIVRSIVALAQELGRKVVAEGVERVEDVGFLRSIGAEYAQGFYYGEAMPDRDVIAMLRVINKSERKLQRRGYFRTKPKKVAAAEPATAQTSAPAAAQKPRKSAKAGKPANGVTAPAPGSLQVPNGAANAAAQQGQQRLRIGADLPAAAVRLRPRGPQPQRAPPPTAADMTPPTLRPTTAPPALPPMQPTPLRPNMTAPPSHPMALPMEPLTHPSMAAFAPPGGEFQFPPPPHANGSGQPPGSGMAPMPNLEGLPPAIAASIARLAAGSAQPTRPEPQQALSSLSKKVSGGG